MKAKNFEQELVGLLVLLAEQTGEQISPARLEFMANRLRPLGSSKVCAALTDMLETARRFPTVGEIKSTMGLVAQSDDDKARETGERIWTALTRFGSQHQSRWSEIAEYIGPIGLEVVKMQGGWRQICDTTTYDNAGMLKAQWRELAEVLVRKGKTGDLETPPDFTQLPDGLQSEIKRLEDKLSL